MKLLTKTTIYIATLSLFLFFIMGIIFFQILKNTSISELNRELVIIKEEVEKNFSFFEDNLSKGIPGVDSIAIKHAGNGISEFTRFEDTIMFDYRTEQYRTYRYMEFSIDQPDRCHIVKIFKSTTQTDKLVERITLMMTLMVILFLAGIFILNRYMYANLWRDFFRTLEKLKQFEAEKKHVELGDSDIEEFVELKKVLENMTRRLSKDYGELRDYTNHTTHELQTPLAVIKTKTELLLQSGRLGEEEIKLIQAIYTSADHLSRLNKALALITRIENQQFTDREEIKINELADRHLNMLSELIDMREITVRKKYSDPEQAFMMDPGLADVLMTNLLKNAVIHNMDGGRIEVEIRNGEFILRNSGEQLAIKEEELFSRFARDTNKAGSFGLGLSLVKKICDYYALSVAYHNFDGMHIFTLKFT